MMRRSRDLLWLVAVLALIALAAVYGQRPRNLAPTPTPAVEAAPMLALELSPFKDFHEAYYLEIDEPYWKADFESLKGFHGTSRLELKRSDLDALRQRLQKAGITTLTDADSGDPENQVLYTRLAVHWQGFSSRTVWRGLPAAQGKIAEALMEGPWADNLRRGLQSVQTRQTQIVSGKS